MSVFKQNLENLNSGALEIFKWNFEGKEVPFLFVGGSGMIDWLEKEKISFTKIEELISDNLDKLRKYDNKDDNDLNTFYKSFDAYNYYSSGNNKCNDNNNNSENNIKEFFTGRILTLEKFFVYFPDFFKYHYETLDVLMKDNNGSLHITWRYYIAIMVYICIN